MTSRFRVFLDSNVLISALIGDVDAAPVILVDWLTGEHLGPALTSKCNVEEVERNLVRKLPQAAPLWKPFLQRTGVTVVACKKKRARGINPKDAPVVAAAVAAKTTHFVTGDKRLIEEMKKAKMKAPLPVTPREMLDAILSLPKS